MLNRETQDKPSALNNFMPVENRNVRLLFVSFDLFTQ